jgi:hypothetical protein
MRLPHYRGDAQSAKSGLRRLLLPQCGLLCERLVSRRLFDKYSSLSFMTICSIWTLVQIGRSLTIYLSLRVGGIQSHQGCVHLNFLFIYAAKYRIIPPALVIKAMTTISMVLTYAEKVTQQYNQGKIIGKFVICGMVRITH